MTITVDRNSGLFSESVCDLINIKSQRLNTLVNQMQVPPIEHKENIKRLLIDFKPVTISYDGPAYDASGQVIPGGITRSTLKIGKMENHSLTIGQAHMINIVFKDIFAETRVIVPGQPELTAPFFASGDWDKIATINISPSATMHFRVVPINPPKEENPEVKNPLGLASLIKMPANRNEIGFKGFVFNKATIPFHSFFIN